MECLRLKLQNIRLCVLMGVNGGQDCSPVNVCCPMSSVPLSLTQKIRSVGTFLGLAKVAVGCTVSSKRHSLYAAYGGNEMGR